MSIREKKKKKHKIKNGRRTKQTKKNFMVFERDKKNKVSKNSRLYDLLDKFNLSNRLVRSQGEMNTTLKENINYTNVYELLEKYRKESKDFLNEALGTSEI